MDTFIWFCMILWAIAHGQPMPAKPFEISFQNESQVTETQIVRPVENKLEF